MDSMSVTAWPKMYEYYQQSVLRNPRSPSYWLSIGAMFYMASQPRDSFDGVARSINLNPFLWESWYNVGVLVSLDVPQPWYLCR